MRVVKFTPKSGVCGDHSQVAVPQMNDSCTRKNIAPCRVLVGHVAESDRAGNWNRPLCLSTGT